jgi:hypothetical protein
MAERDECWLLEEAGDGASQLLCRTNMTNYTLAWSSSASGTDQDLDYNEPGNSFRIASSNQSPIVFITLFIEL